MAKHPKFEIIKGKNEEYYFSLTATNGEKILSSEGYKAKSGCIHGVESVRKNGPVEGMYVKNESSNGKFYFNLKASNGQIIGTSQMYASAAGRDNGIQSVLNNCGIAELEDNS